MTDEYKVKTTNNCMKEDKLKQELLNYIAGFFIEYIGHETAFVTRAIPRHIFDSVALYKRLKEAENAYCMKPNGECTYLDDDHEKHPKG